MKNDAKTAPASAETSKNTAKASENTAKPSAGGIKTPAPGEKYVTLASEGESEFTDRRSLFIGHAKRAQSEAEAEDYIKKIKSDYADATHNVYAYMIGSNITRFSDDGEPSGTAGLPIVDVIKRGGFTDAVIVVTRYFGGTLLGTGGLVHAYGATAKAASEAAGIAVFTPHRVFEITASYSDFQKIKNEFSAFSVTQLSVEYGGEVAAKVAVKAEKFENFKARLRDLTAARIRTGDAETVMM